MYYYRKNINELFIGYDFFRWDPARPEVTQSFDGVKVEFLDQFDIPIEIIIACKRKKGGGRKSYELILSWLPSFELFFSIRQSRSFSLEKAGGFFRLN